MRIDSGANPFEGDSWPNNKIKRNMCEMILSFDVVFLNWETSSSSLISMFLLFSLLTPRCLTTFDYKIRCFIMEREMN